jgi:23S rRNA pseudouridine1911/1915/1917 synthase
MKLTFEVSREEAGKRVDIFLSEVSNLTRSKIQNLIKYGKVFLKEKPLYDKSYKVKEGDIFLIQKDQETTNLSPYNEINIKVLYEDKEILVVYKPYGLLTHPTNYEKEKTLVNAILSFCKLPDSDDYFRPGIVHRLDKLTEGIMVIAKTEEALLSLQKAFMEREVEKEYLAIVHNFPPSNEGAIELLIKRANSKKGRFKTSTSKGKTAYTKYKLLATKYTDIGPFSKLLLYPKTGRTHQIRVHLVAMNMPIVGDPLYSRKHKRFERMYLLAKSIAFKHPKENKYMRFSVEEPSDFQRFWDSL